MSSSNYPSNSQNFFQYLTSYELPGSFDVIIVGWKLKTPENIGGLIRLASNLGISKVILVLEEDIHKRQTKIDKVSRSAAKYVHVEPISENDLKQFIPTDYKWIALETHPDSKNIYLTDLPDKMTLFIGNEITGLPDKIIESVEKCVHIPMPGPIPSMNVVQAASVALFEWYRGKVF